MSKLRKNRGGPRPPSQRQVSRPRDGAKLKTRRVVAKRRRPGIVVLALVSLLVIALLAFWWWNQQKTVPGQAYTELVDPSQTADSKAEKRYPFDQGNAKHFYPFEDKIVMVTGEYLGLADLDGYTIFDEDSGFNEPLFLAEAGLLAIADRRGSQLRVLNNKGQVLAANLEGTAGQLALGQDKFLAVIEERPDQPGFLHVFDLQEQAKRFSIQFAESGYPLAASFTPDLGAVDVLLTNTNGNEIQPVVKRYDLTGQQIGQKIPENAPYLMTALVHDKEGLLYTAGVRNILRFNLVDRFEDFSLEDRILSLVRVNDKPVVVASSVDGLLTIYDFSQDQPSQARLDLPAKDLHCVSSYGNKLLLGLGNKVYFYDLDRQSLSRTIELDSPVVKLGNSGRSLTAIAEDGVYSLP